MAASPERYASINLPHAQTVLGRIERSLVALGRWKSGSSAARRIFGLPRSPAPALPRGPAGGGSRFGGGFGGPGGAPAGREYCQGWFQRGSSRPVRAEFLRMPGARARWRRIVASLRRAPRLPHATLTAPGKLPSSYRCCFTAGLVYDGGHGVEPPRQELKMPFGSMARLKRLWEVTSGRKARRFYRLAVVC
jgi:hypothetical protein